MGKTSKIVKIKSIAKYNGHNFKANKSVDLNFLFNYDELVNYIQLVQLLNENTDIIVKIEDKKPIKLGSFMINQISIDHDGQAKIRFNSLLDYVEADSINELVGETFQIILKAAVEDAEEDDEDEE